jgi:hypothetical protein
MHGVPMKITNKSVLTKEYNVLSTIFSVVTTELKLFTDSNSKFNFLFVNGKFT